MQDESLMFNPLTKNKNIMYAVLCQLLGESIKG